MHVLDSIMKKILPKTDKQAAEREESTRSVVEVAVEQRKDAQKAMIEAYRKAGIAIATPHRRWDD